MSNRIDEMKELLKSEATTTVMIAELRDKFLDMSVANNVNGYDVLTDVMSCEKHVLYYIAQYIDFLEQLNNFERSSEGESVKELEF